MGLHNYQIPRIKRYFYKILDQKVIINCSNIIEDVEKIVIYFEHIVGDTMSTACCIIPDFLWIERGDFSKEDIEYFEEKIKEEQEEIFCYARKPGKIVSEKESQEIERILYPKGRRYAYNSIVNYTESIQVTEREKEAILNKIASFSKKPSRFLRGIIILLLFVILLCVIYAMFEMGSTLTIVACICQILAIIAVIGIYFWGGVYAYDVWKREVKGIRTHTVYKTLVIPFSVWQSEGFYKNYYMNFTTVRGLPFVDSHIISKEVYDDIDNMRVWAYFYEDTIEKYQGRYRIFLIGERV